MSKAKILVLLLMMLLMLAASPVIASAARPIVGSGTFTVLDTQYSPQDAYGPSIYYGSDVKLDYTLTLHWSSITYPNGDVRQTLTASGTVNIYDVTDLSNPIDTRSCSVSLTFYDAGGDACIPMGGGFYDVNWTHSSLQNMERVHHLHEVSGVYTRMAWVRNGEGGGKVTVFTHPPTILIVDE